MTVDPADCPICEAPPCFRYALTRSLEGAYADYTPTNWKGFSEHFMIKLTSSIATPEHLVSYWVDSHINKDTHTIKAVLEFAQQSHHKVLLEKFKDLISAHLVADHKLKLSPQDCLTPCEKCTGWDPQTLTQDKSPDHCSSEHQCVSHNYSGPVTNHFYNIQQMSGDHKLEVPQFKPDGKSDTPPSQSPPSHTHTVTKSDSHTPKLSSEKPTLRSAVLKQNQGSKEPLTAQTDLLQDLGNRLFDDVFPYSHLQRCYHGKVKEAIRICVIIFLLYQGLAVTIMSICDNGGLIRMFTTDHENRYTASVCWLIAFTLRFLVRVVTPLCCSLHIPIMASKPHIPNTGLSRNQALPRIFKVHEHYSSEDEVVELQNQPDTVFDRSEEMTKRRIRAVWIPMTNAAFITVLLLYLGAFLVCESNTLKGGVCKSLDRTIITLPLVNVQIHILIIIESFSVFVCMLLASIVVNCYYHENTIAKYAVTIGKEAESVHHAVRRRWAVMDWYSLLMPLVLSSVTLLSLSTGESFTPAPTHHLEGTELVNWYFWIIVLTVLQYLAYSCNRMAKTACLWGALLSVVFVYIVEVETTMVPYGSILVLLYCGLSAVCFNLVYSLCVCHLCHARETGGVASYVWSVCCLISALLLTVSLFVTVYREVAHLTSFVHVL